MATPAAVERFDIGRTIGRAVGAIRRNIGLLAMLGGGLYLLPSFLIRFAVPVQAPVPGALPAWSWVQMIASLAGIVVSALLVAAVTEAVVADQRGERPAIGPVLALAAPRVVPLIALLVLMYAALLVASLFFLIPAIFLGLMWTVAVPVLIVERPGVFASFGRSRALTKGARGQIFLVFLGLFVVAGLVFGTLLFIGGTYTAASGVGWFAGAVVATAQGFGPLAIIYAVVSAAVGVTLAVVFAAVYVELRYVRDGERPESLAAVFA